MGITAAKCDECGVNIVGDIHCDLTGATYCAPCQFKVDNLDTLEQQIKDIEYKVDLGKTQLKILIQKRNKVLMQLEEMEEQYEEFRKSKLEIEMLRGDNE